MFRRLDQRSQKFYKDVATMVRRINSKRSTIKTEVYKTQSPKRFHALLHKVLLNYAVLKEIVKKTDFMKDVPLGVIIAYEILTKKIRNDGFRRQFKKILGDRTLETVHRKTWIRINTLKGKSEDLAEFNMKDTCIPNVFEIVDSQDASQTYKNLDDIESYDEDAGYSSDENVADDPEDDDIAEEDDIDEENDINTDKTRKTSRDLFKMPEILEKVKVQNFSSCLPAFILNPEPNSFVIDATAAPGNKTTHLCSIMGDTGKILAFERNKERYDVLVDQVQKYGASNIETVHKDFLKVKPEEYKPDYVLLDPSCSGSGIHINYKQDQKRIETLRNFQSMMLNHALKFNPKALVYSVCSRNKEEGEDVVKEALEKNPGFYLENLGNYTSRRGIEGYDFSDKVIRTGSSEEGDIGFFVALFRRKEIE